MTIFLFVWRFALSVGQIVVLFSLLHPCNKMSRKKSRRKNQLIVGSKSNVYSFS